MTRDIAIIDFLSERASQTQPVRVNAGKVVCSEGQDCSDLVIVTSGDVRVYKPAVDGRSISLYHIARGESCIITAGCILNQNPFPAVVAETMTNVEGIAVPAMLVRRWMHDSELWRNYVFMLLGQRFADVIELANALAFEPLESRIIAWLLKQSAVKGIDTTHQEIAEELGSSREVVSRNLKALEHAGLLQLSRGKIRVLNREGLKGHLS